MLVTMVFFDESRAETSHNMRYLVNLFGYLTFISYLCRRICDVTNGVLSHKVGMRYVYTRKRQLDGLPLGCF